MSICLNKLIDDRDSIKNEAKLTNAKWALSSMCPSHSTLAAGAPTISKPGHEDEDFEPDSQANQKHLAKTYS